MEQFALNFIIRLWVHLFQGHQQEHPYQIRWNTINIIHYHKQYPQQCSWIFYYIPKKLQ